MESKPKKSNPNLAVQRLDSDDNVATISTSAMTEISASHAVVKTYSTDEERMEAMRQFHLEQAIESEKRQAAEAQFLQKRDKFYELEKKVDEHISDAVRHAEAAIQMASDELSHVKSLINAQKALLGQLAVEKESIDPTDLQKIAESNAKA